MKAIVIKAFNDKENGGKYISASSVPIELSKERFDYLKGLGYVEEYKITVISREK